MLKMHAYVGIRWIQSYQLCIMGSKDANYTLLTINIIFITFGDMNMRLTGNIVFMSLK